jgi:hypothetical protein
MRSPYWRPPTDVIETEEYVLVRVEIAGMREEDFVIGKGIQDLQCFREVTAMRTNQAYFHITILLS